MSHSHTETASYDLKMLEADYNWREAFRYAKGFTAEDVASITAFRDGENDERNWLMYGVLKDGRHFYVSAGCDYTGWDCQAGGYGDTAPTFEALRRDVMDVEGREHFGLQLGSEAQSDAGNASEKRVPCHEDVGFGFRCLREKGHAGFHTWDPKRLLGEDPVTDEEKTHG